MTLHSPTREWGTHGGSGGRVRVDVSRTVIGGESGVEVGDPGGDSETGMSGR